MSLQPASRLKAVPPFISHQAYGGVQAMMPFPEPVTSDSAQIQVYNQGSLNQHMPGICGEPPSSMTGAVRSFLAPFTIASHVPLKGQDSKQGLNTLLDTCACTLPCPQAQVYLLYSQAQGYPPHLPASSLASDLQLSATLFSSVIFQTCLTIPPHPRPRENKLSHF